MYPATTPNNTGMTPKKPRPNKDTKTVTTKVKIETITASCESMPGTGSPTKPAIFIALGANSKPMIATMAPIAAGGNRVSIQPTPTFFTKKDSRTKHRPKTMKPLCAAP